MKTFAVLYDPEVIEDVDETTDLEALEDPGETENIDSADPVILRRSERLKGKTCLMLLSLLPSGAEGFTGGLALPSNDWVEELIKKMIRQTAKKVAAKAYDTFDIFGDCDALSPNFILIAISILVRSRTCDCLKDFCIPLVCD